MYLFEKDRVVLDYGCGSGTLLREIADRIGEGIGVDLDERLIAEARQRNSFSHIRFIHGDAKTMLPFDDGSFDVITAMGVLEHVGPETPILEELHRVLRPDGYLVVEVPSKGLFRIFDVGNIKYRLPRLHRWFYYYVARRPKYYEENFGPQAPMFGQFSRDANRHKHYSTGELREIAAPWFRMEHHIYHGVFYELIQFTEIVVNRPLGKAGSGFFSWLARQDDKLVSPNGGANVVAIFQRRN
jgi:SAM-dependent methyltransferase